MRKARVEETRLAGGIAYEERGEGYPFVALHGYSLDRHMSIGAFEPLFDEAGRATGEGGRRYRRIYPDLPFMGESADGIPSPGHDGMLEAMARFLRELVPTGPFLLAGESYGGYLARGLAREFADRAGGLFFLCPSILAGNGDRDVPDPIVLREEGSWREAAKADGATSEDLSDYEAFSVVRSQANFRRTRAEVISGIRVARLAALQRGLGGAGGFSFDRLGKAGTADERFDPPFDRPACFFLGRQDPSTGWRDALRLAERYPRASYHILDAAGHNAQIEAPEAFAAAFRAWIADCEA
jgi:pimeloyl-ACP methyl ester carboxylesterase